MVSQKVTMMHVLSHTVYLTIHGSHAALTQKRHLLSSRGYSVHIRITVFELCVMKEERKTKKDKKFKLLRLFFSAFVSGSKTPRKFLQ